MSMSDKKTPEIQAALDHYREQLINDLRAKMSDPDCACARCNGLRQAIQVVKNHGKPAATKLPPQAMAALRSAVRTQIAPHADAGKVVQ